MISKICALLLLTLNCNAQISIDSLLLNIDSNFEKTGTREYLMENFTVFESKNKKDRFDLFLDSTNKLKEYIGLSIVHYKYDKLNRISLIEGFNSYGNRSYWDFPEITVFQYIGDTIVLEFNDIKNEICNCRSIDTLSNMVIEKEINTDTLFNRIRISTVSQDSMMKLIYSVCSNGEICNTAENVSFIYREFDKNYKSRIIHERYYDNKLKLANGNHSIYISENGALDAPFVPYAYSLRELINGDIKTVKFYDKKGELVGMQNYDIVYEAGTHVHE